MTATELLPGLHLIEELDGPRRLCQVVVEGSDRILIVDAGLPETPARTLLPFLRRSGLEEAPIVLVLTHPDADHRGGAPALRDVLPRLEVWGHELDAEQLSNPERALHERYLAFVDDGIAPEPQRIHVLRARLGEPVSLDRRIRDDVELDLGGRRAEAIHAPGHSAGSLVVWLPDERAALVGDAVMGRGIPTVDGALMYPPMFSPPAAYRATIERLLSLEPRLLLAGHEPPYRDAAVLEFLLNSREAVEWLSALVYEALEVRWVSFGEICDRVAKAYSGLEAVPRFSFAMTVDGFAMTVDGLLAELVESGSADLDAGSPRRFRKRV